MNEQIDENLLAELLDTGLPVYRLGRSEGHLHPRYLMAILRIARTHNVGLIHAHNDGSLAWGMAAKLARPGLKLVYTQHAQGIGQSVRGLRRSAYRLLVDHTVAISPFIAEEARVLTRGGVSLVPNGIDLGRFRWAGRPPAQGCARRIVHVGRFAPIKGQDILIEALALARSGGTDLKCTLVGASSDAEFLAEVRALITRHGLNDDVSIVLDRTDVENFLKPADVFVLPSREEGFGIAIIEAMASGLPVVVSATGGTMDIVSDGDNGLWFEAGNAADLAVRLGQISGDPKLRTRLAAASSRTAGQYDIGATLIGTVALYRTLLARKGAQGVENSAASETPATDRPAA